MITTIYNEMRHARRTINGNSDFHFYGELNSSGDIKLYLWSSDFKDTILTYSFNLDEGCDGEKALEAIAYIIGYVAGYKAAQDKANEVEFGPLEEVKREPETVEA